MVRLLPCVRCLLALFLPFTLFCFVSAEEGFDQSANAVPTPEFSNMIVATQAIGGPYQFTDEAYLIEVAREIELMGSNLIKFALNPRRYAGSPYFLEEVEGIASMVNLFEKHPVYQEVMEMNFRFYHIWAVTYAKTRWQDGMSREEEAALYEEFHEFAVYLLNEYQDSGKVFFLGHWEGDWLLQGALDPDVDATPERIRGFAQFLNIRQRAVNDARNEFSGKGVAIYHYTEVNMVWKGIDGTRPTLTNSVLPLVDIDFVSYSAYDAINRENMREDLHRALDHIESQLKPRSDIVGKRVFVGEYGIKAAGVKYDPEAHNRRNREVTHAILEWGCPFALYWQFYCNEPRGEGYQGYWLVNDQQEKTPLYESFKDYYTSVREFISTTTKRNGVPPDSDAIRKFALDFFAEDRSKLNFN